MWWQIGAAANAIVAVAYVGIALAFLRTPQDESRLGPGDLRRRAPARVGEP